MLNYKDEQEDSFFISKSCYDRERQDIWLDGISVGIVGTIIIFALLIAVIKYFVV